MHASAVRRHSAYCNGVTVRRGGVNGRVREFGKDVERGLHERYTSERHTSVTRALHERYSVTRALHERSVTRALHERGLRERYTSERYTSLASRERYTSVALHERYTNLVKAHFVISDAVVRRVVARRSEAGRSS